MPKSEYMMQTKEHRASLIHKYYKHMVNSKNCNFTICFSTDFNVFIVD